MTDEVPGNNPFRELEDQNPAVARAFRLFRRRAHPAATEIVHHRDLAHRRDNSRGEFSHFTLRIPWVVWQASPVVGLILLAAALLALALSVGPSVIHFLAQHWKGILLPTGGVCLGAGMVLLVSRLGAAPLRAVDPPDELSDEPLHELETLAERTSSRNRAAYRFQLIAVAIVGTMFVSLVVWSMIMVSQKKILYASVFGSGGVAMAILTQWKWQPFDRINQARLLADNSDTLATGLRLRMKTISEIQDPHKREKAQWKAVEEYLDRSK